MSGESSSTVSQSSYDPSKPNFLGMDSEIPASDSVSVDTGGTADTAESGSSTGAGGGPTFSKKSKGRICTFLTRLKIYLFVHNYEVKLIL